MSLNRELLIDRIKELSQTLGISSTKALQESGAGKDFVANLKKGQSPSIEKIALIADYFGVTVDYLLGKEAQKEKPDGIPAELWNTLSADPQKMHLAILISKMSHEQLVRIEKLLDAALLLPPE